jgi:hypothetical protein
METSLFSYCYIWYLISRLVCAIFVGMSHYNDDDEQTLFLQFIVDNDDYYYHSHPIGIQNDDESYLILMQIAFDRWKRLVYKINWIAAFSRSFIYPCWLLFIEYFHVVELQCNRKIQWCANCCIVHVKLTISLSIIIISS